MQSVYHLAPISLLTFWDFCPQFVHKLLNTAITYRCGLLQFNKPKASWMDEGSFNSWRRLILPMCSHRLPWR